MEVFSEEIVPEILSTHPANERRAQDLDAILPEVNKPFFILIMS
jgi:hypothetical protein